MKPSEAVAVRLMGGLGNQLFQYAAGRAASLRLGCPLVLDLAPLEARVEGQVERTYMLDAFRVEAVVAEASLREGWAEYDQPSYCYDPAFAEIGPGTRLNGYFQSEAFFAPHREQLRGELSLAVPVSAAFEAFGARIRNAALPVSVHIRRGDFASDPHTLQFHGVCGPEHYLKARRIVEGLTGTAPDYFVFSDDPQAAAALFSGVRSVTLAETPPEAPWEDMMLIAQCRHHILANSSFSWWSSWLNARDDKIMVAPRRWVAPAALRSLNTADLYLEDTIII